MANQQHTGPTSTEGKAHSSRNAERHGLTNLHPVVTAADRPEFDALRANLLHSIKPAGFLQELTFRRILNAAWNMQRALKLEDGLRQLLDDNDPMDNSETLKQAELFHRYFLRYEGSYRAGMREIEHLQRLQLAQAAHFGDDPIIGELHNVEVYQRVAKRNTPKSRSKANSKPTVNDFDECLAERLATDPEFAAIIASQRGQVPPKR